MLKAHVDHGFALIKNDTSGFKSEDDYVDYLVELTRKGLEQRTEESAPRPETTTAFGGLLKLEIGWENDVPVSVEFNRRTNFASPPILARKRKIDFYSSVENSRMS